MKKTIIVLFVVSVISFVVYYLYNKEKDKKRDSGEVGGIIPLPSIVVPSVVEPPKIADKVYDPFSGEGKEAVLLAESAVYRNKLELEKLLSDSLLSIDTIFTGTNNELFKNPILGGQTLPIYIDGEKLEIIKRGGNIVFDKSGIFVNVNKLLSIRTDFLAKTGVDLFPLLEGKNDSNLFIDRYPCKLTGCKRNDKKRNEEVMSSGALETVINQFAQICRNYVALNEAIKTEVKNYSIQKLKKSGWNFPGY